MTEKKDFHFKENSSGITENINGIAVPPEANLIYLLFTDTQAKEQFHCIMSNTSVT